MVLDEAAMSAGIALHAALAIRTLQTPPVAADVDRAAD
jgi:hypothetical protein